MSGYPRQCQAEMGKQLVGIFQALNLPPRNTEFSLELQTQMFLQDLIGITFRRPGLVIPGAISEGHGDIT